MMLKYLITGLCCIVGLAAFVLIMTYFELHFGGFWSYFMVAIVFSITGWIYNWLKTKKKEQATQSADDDVLDR